jgi:hypothetical protein
MSHQSFRDASSHRGRDPQRRVDADEIVLDESREKPPPCDFELLGKRVRQPSEPAHSHPHIEVLAFEVGRADELLLIGIADHPRSDL